MHFIFDFNLKIACVLSTLVSIYVTFRYFHIKHESRSITCSYSTMTFLCILFTSGLDMGLIMFPLIEFKRYASPEYLGIHPLSLEIGYWSGTAWLFYFMTTFYFVFIEPHLKIFEHKYMQHMMYILLLLTCAFSAKLFVDYFNFYIPKTYIQKYPELFTHSKLVLYTIILITVATITAVRSQFIVRICFGSIIFFAILIVWGLFILFKQHTLTQYYLTILTGLHGYIEHINLFITPMNSYHGFYMYWWFSWSLIIGKFVAQYVPQGTTPIKLCLWMLIIPIIPLTIWYALLYLFFTSSYRMTTYFSIAMLMSSILFLMNSLTSIFQTSAFMLSHSSKKLNMNQALCISYFATLIFFIGYAGLSHPNEAMIEIDYVGSFAIFLLYYIAYVMMKRRHIFLPFIQNKNA